MDERQQRLLMRSRSLLDQREATVRDALDEMGVEATVCFIVRLGELRSDPRQIDDAPDDAVRFIAELALIGLGQTLQSSHETDLEEEKGD